MLIFLLDTNIVKYLIEGNVAVRDRTANAPGTVLISTLVLEEILIQGFGVEINNIRSGRSKANLELVHAKFAEVFHFLAGSALTPYTNEAEALFKTYRAAKHKGMDGRIAAHAVTLGAVLVTENVRDFTGVPDLVVENWAE